MPLQAAQRRAASPTTWGAAAPQTLRSGKNSTGRRPRTAVGPSDNHTVTVSPTIVRRLPAYTQQPMNTTARLQDPSYMPVDGRQEGAIRC